MKIGACWIKKTEDGKTYMSCKLEIVPVEMALGAKSFALFKNKDKEKENQPDYNIVWSEGEKNSQKSSSHESGDFEDDIPF